MGLEELGWGFPSNYILQFHWVYKGDELTWFCDNHRALSGKLDTVKGKFSNLKMKT